jgi:Flp pilus assembly pilin Flp
MNRLWEFLTSEDGTTATEYAVMLGLIIGVMVATLQALGSASGGMWANNNSQLQAHGF